MTAVVTAEDVDEVAFLEQDWGFPFHPRFRESLTKAIATARTRGEAIGAEWEQLECESLAFVARGTCRCGGCIPCQTLAAIAARRAQPVTR